MRTRTVAILLAACLLTAGAGCKRRSRAKVQMTEEEAPQLASTVHVADPRSAAQLLSGFYDIEQNAWRWTAGKFSVVLRVPRNAAQKGALLRLKFSVPDAVMQKLRPLQVGASIEGMALKPQTYTQPGELSYDPDVPSSVLVGESARVNFTLDKWLPAGAVEERELGLIVTSIGFETK